MNKLMQRVLQAKTKPIHKTIFLSSLGLINTTTRQQRGSRVYGDCAQILSDSVVVRQDVQEVPA